MNITSKVQIEFLIGRLNLQAGQAEDLRKTVNLIVDRETDHAYKEGAQRQQAGTRGYSW